MPSRVGTGFDRFIGREPERLSLEERQELSGKWIALQIYSPATTPLRRIEAAGGSVSDCASMLGSRGLNPREYEFTLMIPPY